MNEDYLWDRTGEPDPEIQQLEQVLSTLRYQPQPLELPAGIRPERARRFLPTLAIAAAIALMILAAGLWSRLHRQQTPVPERAQGRPAETERKNPQLLATSTLADAINKQGATAQDQATIKHSLSKPVSLRNSFAESKHRHRGAVLATDDLTAAQRDEGYAAKEQLMLALRVASAKLNFAQRRTQGSAPGTIRNQHKVG